MQTLTVWSIGEMAFETRGTYAWDRFPLQAELQGPEAEDRLTLDACWDGERRWIVRYTLPRTGEWRWRLAGEAAGDVLGAAEGIVRCIEAAPEDAARNPNLRGHVRVSPNGRYFVYADGTPLFWVGDTNWNMMGAACGRDGPFRTYVEDRLRKRFNVIQTQMFNMLVKNEGGLPFPSYTRENPCFDELNPAFFRGVDARMQAVWEAGFTVAAHPTWIGKHAPVLPQDALRTTRYLLARYGAFNLLWSLSGEYQYSYPVNDKPGFWTADDWRRLGREAAARNPYRHPITVHPSSRYRPNDPATWAPEARTQSSSGEFHDEPWLDFNWTQTGHLESMLWFVPYRQEEDYHRTPVKPVLHSEGWYERHGRGGRTGDVYDTRWQAWVAVLSGSCGHTYGAEGVWAFYDLERPDAPLPYDTYEPVSWQEGLALPGSDNLAPFRRTFESIAWWTLQPHRDWVRIDGRTPSIRRLDDPHCAAAPGRLYVVYVPRGNAGAALELSHLGPNRYAARWVHPRTGASTAIGLAADATGEGVWTAPPVPDASDWALVLEADGGRGDA